MEEKQEFRQITLDEWLYWKEDIRDKLRETAGNFVYIGYRLKQIRDSGMYDGAEDIFEFALKEYGLGKSTVSRFIAINEKFSEGGNSLELKAEYRDIGSSKLSEMLTLPDAECSLITERTTVKEIRDLKSFLRQQPSEEQGEAAAGDVDKVSGEADGEAGTGSTDAEPEEAELTPLEKCLVEYFRDRKELLNDLMALVHGGRFKAAAELINPSGYTTYRKGLVFLFMYDFSQGVKYKVFGHAEISELAWEKFLGQIYAIYAGLYEAGTDDVHGAYYREPGKTAREPGKEPPEMPVEVLPPEPGGMPAQGDENTVETSKVLDFTSAVATSQQEKKAEADEGFISESAKTSPGLNVPPSGAQKTEEASEGGQLPGQMEAADYPELLPESSCEEIREGQGSSHQDPPGSPAESREETGETSEVLDPVDLPADSQTAEAETAEPEVTGTEIPETGEAAESSGMPETAESAEDIRTDANGYMESLRKTFTIWDKEIPLDFLEKAHRDATGLAAAIEKLMDISRKAAERSGRF